MDKNIDKETQQVLSDEKKIEMLCQHEGWALVRQKLINRIMDLQSILNVDGNATPEQIAIDLRSRANAISILTDFLQDIEGTAQKSKDNTETFKKTSYIIRYEN